MFVRSYIACVSALFNVLVVVMYIYTLYEKIIVMKKLSAVFYIVSPHLPQGTIKVQHIFLSSHTFGVKVFDPQRLQTLGSGECHVRLPILKTSTEAHLNTVQSHSL